MYVAYLYFLDNFFKLQGSSRKDILLVNRFSEFCTEINQVETMVRSNVGSLTFLIMVFVKYSCLYSIFLIMWPHIFSLQCQNYLRICWIFVGDAWYLTIKSYPHYVDQLALKIQWGIYNLLINASFGKHCKHIFLYWKYVLLYWKYVLVCASDIWQYHTNPVSIPSRFVFPEYV